MSGSFSLLAHANGTHTLVDAENGQAMHSRIGPAAEAKLVYADLARLERGLDAPGARVVLHDVGMGTGANAIAALERIRAEPGARGRVSVYSFEAKPEGLRAAIAATRARAETFPTLAPWLDPLETLARAETGGTSRAEFRLGGVGVDWTLLAGDYYARLAEAPAPDAIFFDFYSPKVVPALWSLERFRAVRAQIGGKTARLFTYSASTPVRLHLLAAGFFVGEGVSTGVKNETTAAATRFEDLRAPLAPEWLRKLEASASIAAPSFDVAKALARAHPQWTLAARDDSRA